MTSAAPPESKSGHIDFLDGFRGLMALWVLLFHLQLQVSGTIWNFAANAWYGTYAVDLFMLISGFLMQYHWRQREGRGESFGKSAGEFYVRRFFRIAPVYYLLLIVSFGFYGAYNAWRADLATWTERPWAGAGSLFINPSDYHFSLSNLLAHLTFTFGLIPRYAANNVLPDWSIGLEMQFYWAFPFLVWIGRKASWALLTVAGIVVVYLAQRYIPLQAAETHAWNFPQPTFLLFKLNLFLGGMVLAEAWLDRHRAGYLVLLAVAALYHSLAVPLVVVGFWLPFLLLKEETSDIAVIEWPARILRRALASRAGRFLGNTSYAVYLLHNLILFPANTWLTHQPRFLAHSTPARLLISASVTLPVIYILAYILHRTVELPGITLGKRFLARARQSAVSAA